MRHLLDGDPASNTLSWRWVVGLQTAGKVYLARASNIATYTNGRFDPRGQLVEHAEPLTDNVPLAKPVKPVAADPPPAEGPVMLIVTEDDLTPEQWPLGAADVVAVVGLRTADAYPGSSEAVVRFKQGALADAMARSQAHFGAKAMVLPVAAVDTLVPVIRSFATSSGARAIATIGCPVGPTADRIAPVLRGLIDDGSVPVHVMRRPWDELFWPHATAGFFKLKEKILSVLARLDLDRQAELAFE
jgi:deoxyribodipyrimidine photo-lyase